MIITEKIKIVANQGSVRILKKRYDNIISGGEYEIFINDLYLLTLETIQIYYLNLIYNHLQI